MNTIFKFCFTIILILLLSISLPATSSSAQDPAQTLARITERVSIASDGPRTVSSPDPTYWSYLPVVIRNYSWFSFWKQLFDPPSTLYLWIQNINLSTGWIEINGVDTQQPSIPFT